MYLSKGEQRFPLNVQHRAAWKHSSLNKCTTTTFTLSNFVQQEAKNFKMSATPPSTGPYALLQHAALNSNVKKMWNILSVNVAEDTYS